MKSKQTDLPTTLTSNTENSLSTETTDIYTKAMDALRKADFNVLMDSIRNDDISLHQVFENIKVYQAELVIQNEELINSQLQAEAAVASFTHLFASLPLMAFVVQKNGAIVQSNQAAKNRWRLERMTSIQLYLHSLIHPKDHLRFKRLLNDAHQQPQQVISQAGFEFKTKPLFIGDLYVSYFSKPDESTPLYVVMVVDQTAVIEQQQALEAEKKHFSAYFNASPAGMCALDVDKNWIEFNETLSELLDYSSQTLSEVSWQDLTFPEDIALESRQFSKLISGDIDGFELDKRFVKQDGGLLYAHIAVTCIRRQDKQVDYFVVIVIDITKRKVTEDRMQFIAHHDTLTNLPNRSLLADRFQQSKSFAKRHNTLMAILYLDLDHFKNINDSLGHLIGDKLLIEVAKRLNCCVRDTDTVCRLGGDEFLILLTNLETFADVANVSKKLLSELSRPYQIEMYSLSISCSIGASFYPMDGDSFESLLQNADTALYQAKFNGRNDFQFFTAEMNIKAQQRLYIENEMRTGLNENQFSLVYQPQVNSMTSEIIGVEALLRWNHPVMGSVSPATFIPVAEDSGLILELGKFVLTEACQNTKSLVTNGHPMTVSVNISIIQLQRGDIVQLVTDILQQTQFPSHLLELEITESLLASDPEKITSVFQSLKKLGVRFAIDDFGIGYSSFSYLKHFNVDKLKIDQSFIADILTNPEDKIIVNAIVQLAQSLQMMCVAEGVETQEQQSLLNDLSCDYMQGYVFAKPMTQEALLQYLN